MTGRELRDAFLRQVDDLGIPIQQARVAAVYEMGGHYAVCAGPDFYEGRCLILATGVAARGQIPGENRLLGKGVSCCATCDGELYRGRNIAVVCESQSLEEDVRFLQSVAGMWNCSAPTRAAWPIHRAATKAGPRPSRGDDRVTGVRWADATLPVEGVFCLRETVAPQALLSGLAMGKRPYPGGPGPAHQPARLLCRRGLHRPPLPVRQGSGRGQCGGAQRAGFPGTTAGGAAMKPGWLGYLGRLAGVLAGNALLAYGVAAVYLPAGLAVGGATGVGLILHTLFGLGHCCVRLCAEPGPAGGRMGLHRAGVCHQHSGRVAGLSSVSGAVAAFARLFTARNRPLRGPCVRGPALWGPAWGLHFGPALPPAAATRWP